MSPWWPRCCASRPLGTGHSTGQSRTGRRRRGAQAHEEHRHARRSRSRQPLRRNSSLLLPASVAPGVKSVRTATSHPCSGVRVRPRWHELCSVHGCCVCIHNAALSALRTFSFGLERAIARRQARARFVPESGAPCPRLVASTRRVFIKRGAMLRSGLRRAAAASAPLRTLRRNLNLHEYQSAALMAEKGVNVPFGLPASTVEEAVAAAATIGDEEVVIKSQILAGGRGLGSFTNGLKGGVHVIKTSEVSEYAGKMLGGTLVTKQVRVSVRFGLGWR